MIKTIHISAKHDDRYAFHTDGDTSVEHDGYALRIPGLGGGDYTRLSIDNATGQIIGWVPLTEESLSEIMEE